MSGCKKWIQTSECVANVWISGLLLTRKMKICQHIAGHMTKMAAMPINGKHFENLHFRNHWPDFDETFYEASEI